MKKLLFLAAAAALASGPALAAPAQPAPPAAHPHMMQVEMRADAQTRAQRMFARLDANRDGFVTQAEVGALQAQRAAKAQQRAEHRDPAKMLGRLDTDKDGRVSLAEMQKMTLQRFDRVDLNHDGKLTPEERQQAHQQRAAHAS